jgi:hypothetical protein
MRWHRVHCMYLRVFACTQVAHEQLCDAGASWLGVLDSRVLVARDWRRANWLSWGRARTRHRPPLKESGFEVLSGLLPVGVVLGKFLKVFKDIRYTAPSIKCTGDVDTEGFDGCGVLGGTRSWSKRPHPEAKWPRR